jgi:sterol desaturase/sphingolipid hydroxylase (fatty acid hydroxylase superfamily)
MKLEDLLALAIPVAFVLFWGSEYLINRAGGGRVFPKVRWWFVVGTGFFLLLSAANATAPLWLPPGWLARHRLMDLTGLGVWKGALLGYVATSFAMYWFHRAEHRFTVLWRGLHQFHHSIERVDMGGWAVGHPLETVVQTAYITGVSALVLGVDPMAAAIAGVFGTIVNMFSHWNVSTPHWLGYVILRPEQHCLHHEREVHARNYGGDFAIWDQLFGSFANTPVFAGQVGFGRPAIAAMPAMLAFADVNGERSPNQ